MKLPSVGVCGQYKAISQIANWGIDYVEESVKEFLSPVNGEEQFSPPPAKQRKILPIPVLNLFLPKKIRSIGRDVDIDKLKKYSEVAFKRASQINTKVIVFGSGGSRQIDSDISRSSAEKQFVEVLRLIGGLASNYGLVIVVEPLNKAECNFINTVGEGIELVKEVEHPNIRLLADFYHMFQEDESPEILRKSGGLIKHVHVAEKDRRTAPGIKGDDFRKYINELLSISYEGAYSLECKWQDFKIELTRGVLELRRQINSLM